MLPTMTIDMMVKSKVASFAGAALAVLGSGWLVQPCLAQPYPVTAQQKAIANEVAQAGVPLSELAANAPDTYTVRRGDTLWAISGMYLKKPWRWPELWGMNLNEIRNPHLIYPGQKLYLEKIDGRARLRTTAPDGAQMPTETVRLSPRVRSEPLGEESLTTLKSHLIEPFLTQPVIVEENQLQLAPRIVAAQEGRVLLSRGDRAYIRGPADVPVKDEPGQKQQMLRIFRNATPLKDPVTGEVLGYEAQYVGKAVLVRGESTETSTNKEGNPVTELVPATIDLVTSREEARTGDRLLPEPPREFQSYTPHAPAGKVDALIISIYGNAVANAGQNQVVAINRGRRDGIDNGQVLAILKHGQRVIDKTDEARTPIKLPDERNGLLMVFRTFEKLSYGLVLEITDGVKVGDRLINPR